MIEVIEEQLRALHPVGEPRPLFDAVGPSQGRAPKEDEDQGGINVFERNTAPGISGWTVNFIRLASRSPRFLDFLTSLTAGISVGAARGASMLCVSCFTPLANRKADGRMAPNQIW